MAGSIVESVMSLLGPNVFGPIASQLGESPEAIRRGLEGGSAAILSGVAAKVDEPGFMGQFFGMITNPSNTPGALSSMLSNPGAFVSGAPGSTIADLGSRFLSSVFGARLPAVTDAVGQSAGLSISKAGMLMSMASALVLGALGQHVRENDSSAADLANKLKSEALGLTRFLPAGLGSLLGGVPSHAGGGAASVAAAPVAVAKAGTRWLWPVVLLAVLLLGCLWFFNRAKAPVGEAVQTVSDAGNSAVSALGAFFTTKLPNGVELNIPQLGVENKLIAFLNDSSKPVDDTTWFNFDRLLFDTGSATLQHSSQEQLGNIANILKAYPNVHLKIGGYTDNTGDAAANMSLSAARAKSVMDSLVNSGIDASRLSSEGYGEQYPVGDNATEEGRAQNRRIAMRVTEK